MTFQILIISLQIAAVAAFLVLWYFWVKKKLEASFCIEDEDNVLFPFKYFSWLLIGVVLATSITQIHFVRVSASVHERMAVLAGSFKKQDQNTKSIEELKNGVEKLRAEVESNFKALRVNNSPANKMDVASDNQINQDNELQSVSKDKNPLIAAGPRADGQSFAKEAKSATAEKDDDLEKVYSMRLSRNGRSVIDNLRVRKSPSLEAQIIDKLMTGQEVKVTEKRLISDGVWFRIVTPSGKAGWVDYRYLKLEGAT